MDDDANLMPTDVPRRQALTGGETGVCYFRADTRGVLHETSGSKPQCQSRLMEKCTLTPVLLLSTQPRKTKMLPKPPCAARFIGLVLLVSLSTVPLARAQNIGTSVTKQCGSAKITLQCSAASAKCADTKLTVTNSKGRAISIETKPKGLEKYTPVGIACANARDHTSYIVVQYGEHPPGCAFCEWYHLYTLQGRLLTHSDPAILVDKTLPEGQQQYPNNREYNEIAKRLDLDEQDIQLIP